MTPIPPKIRKEIDADPAYKTCMLYGQPGHVCGGRITMEHALIFGGKQVQAKWAIIAVCAAGQDVDNFQDSHSMDKAMNEWVALSRASDQDLKDMCGEGVIRDLSPLHKTTTYIAKRARLIKQYGVYAQIIPQPIKLEPTVLSREEILLCSSALIFDLIEKKSDQLVITRAGFKDLHGEPAGDFEITIRKIKATQQ